MSGITPLSQSLQRGERHESIQTATKDRDGNFVFPHPNKSTDVRVGEQHAGIAFSAKKDSQAERNKRLGAIRAANKNSRSIGGV